MDIWMCHFQSASARSGGFLISSHSLQPSISEAGCAKVLRSFTGPFAAAAAAAPLSPLALSLPLFLCAAVWRLRNNTRQVTVVTLWGIGGCLLLCKSAGAWGSSLSVSTQPSNGRLAVEKPASTKKRNKKNTHTHTYDGCLTYTRSILLCVHTVCVYCAVFAGFRWCRWAVAV